MATKKTKPKSPKAKKPVRFFADVNYEAMMSFQVEQKPKQISVEPRNQAQAEFWQLMHQHTIIISEGAAGTGKTFLAIAAAVEALNAGSVDNIVLVRPAIDAGEKLGFLPGDASSKLGPFMRPLYDSLHKLLGVEQTKQLIADEVIEIAPLAFMRGRTFERSFVVVDEAQNMTIPHAKMVLTRLGFESKMIIGGDLTQNDLPPNFASGLAYIIDKLKYVPDIGIMKFDKSDIVRHPLITQILQVLED